MGALLFYTDFCATIQAMKSLKLMIASFLLLGLPLFADAALIHRVNEAFQAVYGREPVFGEWEYWARRVQKKEKTTFPALVGAMGYAKARGGSPHVLAAVAKLSSSTPVAKTFVTHKHFYPSSLNPNFLPDGTLVKSPAKADVYYIRNGKKSWVTPEILNRWLGENHFYKHDIILTISDSDLARYPQTSSVNPLYVGKVLQHPNGTQYYVDDKLRKRKISAAVRGKLKFPGGNLYPTSAAHLQEFSTGPELTGAKQPGGMVIYSGAFHGGRIWKIEENGEGKVSKRLFLSDYLYEAWYYPDESQRVAVSEEELAGYPRGSNIERYPDGWVVKLGPNIYVIEKEKLRLIASPAIFSAIGYNSKYVLSQFPEFLKRYPKGHPIAGFKGVKTSDAEAAKSEPAPSPNAAINLTKVRPAIRTLIGQINDIYLSVFDKDVTASENKFWVDYVYHGEVTTKEDLITKMEGARISGKKPSITSRTAALPEEVLEQKWFPYMFYFVWQQEPSDEDRDYWFNRIRDGDRDTIGKLGETLQWLRDTSGVTRK